MLDLDKVSRDPTQQTDRVDIFNAASHPVSDFADKKEDGQNIYDNPRGSYHTLSDQIEDTVEQAEKLLQSNRVEGNEEAPERMNSNAKSDSRNRRSFFKSSTIEEDNILDALNPPLTGRQESMDDAVSARSKQSKWQRNVNAKLNEKRKKLREERQAILQKEE